MYWVFSAALPNINGPLTRYIKLPGMFSPPPRVSDPDMHHCTCITHVPWCMPGSLTSGFLWSQRREKTFPAFPAHAQPAILLKRKSPMELLGSLCLYEKLLGPTKFTVQLLHLSIELLVPCTAVANHLTMTVGIWVRSRNFGCLVTCTWFCYQLIAKPGNKTATVLWPNPYTVECLYNVV